MMDYNIDVISKKTGEKQSFDVKVRNTKDKLCPIRKFRLLLKSKKDINPFTPNRMIYVSLLICSIAMTVVPYFLCSLQSPFCSFFSNIGCGGLASTLIAWLIDEANAKKTFQKSRQNRQVLFKKLSDCFDNGLQILIYSLKTQRKDNESRKWYEWIEYALIIAKEDSELLKDCLISLKVFFDNAGEAVYEIQSQNAIMLEYGIIDNTDIQSFKVILSVCDLANKDFQSEISEQKLIEHITMYCGILKSVIGYSKSLHNINEKYITPDLYNFAVKKGIVE